MTPLGSSGTIIPVPTPAGITEAQADARYVRPGVSGPAPSTLLQNGYAFPAVQVPSADANMLDDYEEGTWVPAFTGGSLTVTLANYVKIGRVVMCNMRVTVATIVSASTATFTGLPFSAQNGNCFGGSLAWVDSGTGIFPTTLGNPGRSNTVGGTQFNLFDGNGLQLTRTQLSDVELSGSFFYTVS